MCSIFLPSGSSHSTIPATNYYNYGYISDASRYGTVEGTTPAFWSMLDRSCNNLLISPNAPQNKVLIGISL